MVSVENLVVKYGSRVAVSKVTFEVREREIFGVLGPNGGGKSTLFKVLATMLAPAAGSARVAGFDVERQPAEVRRRIGVVFQSQSLDKKLTIEENLRSQGHLYGLSGSLLTARITEVMGRLRLADRRSELIESLSGGLRRRVEIAKGLLHRPAVLLMDEPSTGLDPGARRDLWNYIEELRDTQGITVLLTTHILDEADRCDRLVLLHHGALVADGTPAELKARIGGDVVVLERGGTRRHAAADRIAAGCASDPGGRHPARRDRQRPPLHHRSGGGVSRRHRVGCPAQADARRRFSG